MAEITVKNGTRAYVVVFQGRVCSGKYTKRRLAEAEARNLYGDSRTIGSRPAVGYRDFDAATRTWSEVKGIKGVA